MTNEIRFTISLLLFASWILFFAWKEKGNSKTSAKMLGIISILFYALAFVVYFHS